jgi:TonB family protein
LRSPLNSISLDARKGIELVVSLVALILAAKVTGATPTPTPGCRQRAFEAYAAAHPKAHHAEPGVVGPVEVSRVKPEYPSSLRTKVFTTGVFIFQAVVTESGSVQDVQVMCSQVPELEAAAIKAISAWRYRPATLNGKPVSFLLTITVNIDFQ